MSIPIPGNTAVWLLGAVIAAYLLSYFVWRGKRRRLSYPEKLSDPRWKSVSRQVVQSSNQCVMCPRKPSQAHHKAYLKDSGGDYLDPWDEEYLRRGWLVPVCGFCHHAYEAGKKLTQH